MKTNFTFNSFRIPFLTLVLAYLSLNLYGQTSHNVNVSNYQFSPNNLTITVGDEVVWTNIGGYHNVNGKQSVFASNPESFGNNLGSGWTYKFVFNTAGTYNYQCDPHAAMGMVGKVTVNAKTVTSSQTLVDGSENIRLFPNPAGQYIDMIVPGNYPVINSVKVFTIAGTQLGLKAFPSNADLKYDISQFKNGIYFMEISAGNQKKVLKFLKQ